MIRNMQKADLDRVASLWLDGNLTAHPFLPAQYWESNLEFVKEALPQAEVYVYEDNQAIQGFIGLNGTQIEGIFVSGALRSQGIGTRLLNEAKQRKPELLLNVYQKNPRAVRFYQREGFEIQAEGLDEQTGERDFIMRWQPK